MPTEFKGKVALVTGAASGIGEASALAFAREGCKVLVSDVNTEGGENTAAMIKRAGGEATFVKADVSNSTEVEALINQTVKTYGRLDLAHNNAGIGEPIGTFIGLSEEIWDNVININLKGVWLCMKYEIAYMTDNGGGAIVNTASVASMRGLAGLPAYVASKHGVAGLTKAAAVEYGNVGIRVNAVCPGVIRTPFYPAAAMEGTGEFAKQIQPLSRWGESSEVADAVVWLCSNGASFITGDLLTVDGGWTAK